MFLNSYSQFLFLFIVMGHENPMGQALSMIKVKVKAFLTCVSSLVCPLLVCPQNNIYRKITLEYMRKTIILQVAIIINNTPEVKTLQFIHDLHSFLSHWKDAGAIVWLYSQGPEKNGSAHRRPLYPCCFIWPKVFSLLCYFLSLQGRQSVVWETRQDVNRTRAGARCERSVFCLSLYSSSFSWGLCEDPPNPSPTHGLCLRSV